MTSDPHNQTKDKTLERDLEEIRSVLADPDSPEPPDLLDQAVLNTARRELARSEKKWPKRFSLRWLGAFATASVIVLALGIVVQQEQESSPPLTSEDSNGVKLKSDAAAPEKEAAAKSQLMQKTADRDESKLRRAAPMAASAARADDFAELEMADAPASLEESMAETLPPEEWLSLLLELKSSNQDQKLAQQIAAFRSAYPDYPMPPELSN
jgi:hypothetical protein